MSRSIDPVLRAYLQHRIREWTAMPGHTAKELAKRAGVSGAQISDAVNKGSIGWQTMTGVLPVLGLTLATLEPAARRWAETHVNQVPMVPKRGVIPRLDERRGWTDLAAATLAEHGELDPEDVAAVGRLGDDPEIFEGPLDVPTVAGLAAALGARRRRLARKSNA